MFKKIILTMLFLFISVVGGLYLFFDGQKPLEQGKIVVVKVAGGMAASQIAGLLEDSGVIRSARAFSLEIKSRGMDNSLQAGEYEFTSGMPTGAILDKLAAGDVRRIKITIPEGFTVKQIAELVDKNNLADKAAFLAAAKEYAPYDYMKTTDSRVEYKSEGFLFPSTYNVSPGISMDDLLAMMVREFDNQLTKEIRQRLKEKDLSVRDYITLASLVEKEAAVADDRKFIAKAFIKRLEIDMPLQSCATIQYILGYPKPELTIEDTRMASEYNTYLHYGLPPGPIANPGLLSMQAALDPAQEDYLYFVARKDGRHIFSRTYEGHLAAIDEAGK